jgi:uncharacterized protein (UPF0261 family)
MDPERTVLILATLDTKSEEIIYLKPKIAENGLNVLVVDAGILGEPRGIVPDVPAAQTAREAGTTLEALRNMKTRGQAIEEMLKGARAVTQRLFLEGRIHGMISLGGAEGGVMAAAAMQVLPPGFPKLIVTPLASGTRPFGPFIGVRDIMVMHSLIDIMGINEISRCIWDNAAAAISGMVRTYAPMKVESRNLVAITTLGTTDRALKAILPILEKAGFKPVIFHSSGVGGQVMEDMIQRGFFCAVLDLCPNELTDHLFGTFHDAGPLRLEAAGKMGIPQVVSTGCMDFFAQGARETVPEKWHDRKMYYHNPSFTLIRPLPEEMRHIALTMVEKLNKARGPVRVVLPLKGMSISGLEGGSTCDPEGDRVFFDTLRKGLKPEIKVAEVNAHVNQKAFVDVFTAEFIDLMSRHGKERRRS